MLTELIGGRVDKLTILISAEKPTFFFLEPQGARRSGRNHWRFRSCEAIFVPNTLLDAFLGFSAESNYKSK
jgi:hypothetical protein